LGDSITRGASGSVLFVPARSRPEQQQKQEQLQKHVEKEVQFIEGLK